mmetsp:Transcript_7965/g.14999  ORF Transcript_7965/g.14999 Transcript_7965/m.14999 type:complete len:144 (+) Transcript_7965:808-1239(+)
MYSARSQLTRTASRAFQRNQNRSAQTVPRSGSEEQMKKDAIEHLKARISKQKEIEHSRHVPHAEEVAEMNKWIKISVLVAAPVCVLTVAKDLLLVEHAHRKEGPEPDYMRIRNKEFPWECEDCELFNSDCWKKCRAERAAGGN